MKNLSIKNLSALAVNLLFSDLLTFYPSIRAVYKSKTNFVSMCVRIYLTM